MRRLGTRILELGALAAAAIAMLLLTWAPPVSALPAIKAGRSRYAARPSCTSSLNLRTWEVSDCAATNCLAGGGTNQCDTVCVDGVWTSVQCLTATPSVATNPTTTSSSSSTTTSTSSTTTSTA